MVTTPLDIVRAVDLDGANHAEIADRDVGKFRVRITPTFTGCPATEQIRSDVELALRSAGYEPTVEFVMAPAWSTDDISRTGRQKLRAAGIAPPSPVGNGSVTVDLPVTCAHCGSRRTRQVAAFGATACKSLHACDGCRQPFESFKTI